MPTTTAALGLLITATIIWYVAEWRHCQEQRQPMNLVRNPLALIWIALQRVWRNRRFIGILICCWLASVGVYRIILDPLVFAPQRKQWKETITVPTTGPSVSQPSATSTRLVIADSGGLTKAGPRYWMWRVLPQFRQLSLALARGDGGIVHTLALGVFAVALITLWFRRPEWLPAHMRQRLVWPTYLTLGVFLVISTINGFGFATALSPDPLDFSGSPASQVLYNLSPLFFFFATAALAAFLWHIVLQVGSGQHGNLCNAVTGAINNWLPIAWLTVIVWVPYTLLMGLTMFLGTISGTMVYIVGTASNIGWTIPTLLCIALLFVPWIILAEGASLLPAIRRNLLPIRSQWQDLLVMLPRYLLIVIPVYAVLDALAWPTIRNSAILTSLSFARSLVELVLLVAIVVLYLELRKGEKAEPERQEVA